MLVTFDELISIMEVLPGILWPVVILIISLVLKDKISTLKHGDTEVNFSQAMDVATADGEFQKEEVEHLLARHDIYKLTKVEVAKAIMKRATEEQARIEADAKATLEKLLT